MKAKKKMEYTVTLEETLGNKPLECLREAAEFYFDIPDAAKKTRDELAAKMAELVGEAPVMWVAPDWDVLDDRTALVLLDMVFEGPQRLSMRDPEEARILKWLRNKWYVDCRDWKDGKSAVSYTLALPELIRGQFQNEDDFNDLRIPGDNVMRYVRSAVTLYGVVTFDELRDLIVRLWPTAEGKGCNEKTCYATNMDYLACLVKCRQCIDEDYFVHEDYICHGEFMPEGEWDPKIIECFLKLRNRHPRWYPKDEEEMEFYQDDWSFMDTPEAVQFEDFLASHGLKGNGERCDVFYDLIVRLQIAEERMPVIMQRVIERLKLKGEKDNDKFCELLMAFANNMRRRINNGHSPMEAIVLESRDRRPPIIKVNPHADVGRNELCPCGSGKKFKKCCGMKSKKAAAISALAQERLDVYLPMREFTSRFVSQHVAPMNTMQKLEAAAERLGITQRGSPVVQLNPETHAAVIGDYAAMMDDQFGLPPIKQLIEQSFRFTGDEARALEMFRQYRYTWLEILDAEPGVGVSCRDLMTGEEGFLMETSFSRDYQVRGMTVCAGIGKLQNGTWMILGTMHPSNFENPATVLRIVLTHLGLPTELPISLSFADQARFAAETIKRINANGRFSRVEYGGLS